MKPARKIKPIPILKIKPEQKINSKAGRLEELRIKLAALPPRLWTFGGVILLVLAIAWFFFAPAKEEAPQTPSPSGAAGTGEMLNLQPPSSTAAADNKKPEKERAFIQSIRLQPPQPTRMDSLKAEVELSPAAPAQLDYTYRWKVNGLVIEEATGDTLNLSTFKKRDLITVTVTPYDGSTAGYAMESPTVAIQSIPPSLEMKALNQTRKIGEPIELQLVGEAPDGGELTFSLESPFVAGMAIDKSSGKISWPLQPGQKGAFYFGAAVQDTDQTKITKIFNITIE